MVLARCGLFSGIHSICVRAAALLHERVGNTADLVAEPLLECTCMRLVNIVIIPIHCILNSYTMVVFNSILRRLLVVKIVFFLT